MFVYFYLLRRTLLLISAKAAYLVGINISLFFLLGKVIAAAAAAAAALRLQQQDIQVSILALLGADVGWHHSVIDRTTLVSLIKRL